MITRTLKLLVARGKVAAPGRERQESMPRNDPAGSNDRMCGFVDGASEVHTASPGPEEREWSKVYPYPASDSHLSGPSHAAASDRNGHEMSEPRLGMQPEAATLQQLGNAALSSPTTPQYGDAQMGAQHIKEEPIEDQIQQDLAQQAQRQEQTPSAKSAQSQNEESDNDSEDDMPLIQRVRTLSKSTISPTPPSPAPAPRKSSAKGKERATKKIAVDESEEDDDAEEITPESSWKLPQYEVLPEKDNDGWRLAKVSMPGLVRHIIELNTDHPEQEFQLLQEVFLPGHQRTYAETPDTNPKLSLLNFHLIASNIIEVYHHYDHDNHPTDPDELFFLAIDKWRVAKQLGKKNSSTIRGIQEFCDVALDIVYFVRDHGLVQVKPKRAARSDKGVKRGPRGAKKAEPAKPNESKKRKTEAAQPKASTKKQKTTPATSSKKGAQPQKVNVLQPRSNAKGKGKAPEKKVKTGRVAKK